MSFFKKHLKLIIFIVLIIAIGSFFFIKSKSSKNTKAEFDPKTETIITPAIQDIQEKITLTGSIDAESKANLQFQTSGQLSWIGVKVGDTVKKYQAIASLNKEILKKQLQANFNSYQSALSTFDDTQDKYEDEKNSNSLTDEMKRILTRSQNTLDNSVINYEIQDLAIKYATISTPIDGIVTEVNQPNNGINVAAYSTIVSIINPSSIYFKAQIDQEDVTRVKVGDKAEIQMDSFPDQTFESEVSYISFTPVSGQTSTVYEIRFKLSGDDNDNLKYRLGMDGDVSILLSKSANALTISTDSLYQDEEQPYVYLKNPSTNETTKQYVKTGIESDDTVEILEGLTSDDQIVISK